MPLSYREAEREIFDPSNDPILRPGYLSEDHQATPEQLERAGRRLRERRRRWRWSRVEPDSPLAGRIRAGVDAVRRAAIERRRTMRETGASPDERRWALRQASNQRANRRLILRDLEARRIWQRDLPWYGAGSLVHCDGDQPARFVVLGDPPQLVELLGASQPIHQLNHQAPIRLDGDLVEEYLAFFCEHVHGDHGGFHVIEEEFTERNDRNDPDRFILTASDLREGQGLADRPGATGSRARRRSYPRATVAVPIAVIAAAESTWTAMATVIYAAELFRALFVVHATGEVEMVVDRNIEAVALQGPTLRWRPRKAAG